MISTCTKIFYSNTHMNKHFLYNDIFTFEISIIILQYIDIYFVE